MCKVNNNDFKLKIHDGWLIATESGDKVNYQGMGIFYSKDGETFSWDDLIAIVEQDAEDDKIQTALYKKNCDDRCYVFDYKYGELNEGTL